MSDTFDKETYWKNRKEGKRGQGEYPSLLWAMYRSPTWPKKEPTKKSRKRLHKQLKSEQLQNV
jgi:hypothetical protein